MKKWAIFGAIIAFSAGLSMLIAPASIAMPHPIDTSQTIDPFGEDVGIVFSSDSHKTKHPPQGGSGSAPGQDQERVDVCHKGKTKSVDPDDLQKHLDHGDALGAC